MVWRYTTPHSLTGWPCVVVRAGTSADMPVGVQLVAGPWQDQVAIAAAATVESALGGWRPPADAGEFGIVRGRSRLAGWFRSSANAAARSLRLQGPFGSLGRPRPRG